MPSACVLHLHAQSSVVLNQMGLAAESHGGDEYGTEETSIMMPRNSPKFDIRHALHRGRHVDYAEGADLKYIPS